MDWFWAGQGIVVRTSAEPRLIRYDYPPVPPFFPFMVKGTRSGLVSNGEIYMWDI